jgi:hypothetical protein
MYPNVPANPPADVPIVKPQPIVEAPIQPSVPLPQPVISPPISSAIKQPAPPQPRKKPFLSLRVAYMGAIGILALLAAICVYIAIVMNPIGYLLAFAIFIVIIILAIIGWIRGRTNVLHTQ